MKTQSKILTAIAVVALSAVAGTMYVARAAVTEPGTRRAHIAERLAELGVTDEQKSQVKAILRKHQPTAQPLIRQFVSERRALRDTIHAPSVDESAIRTQVEKVAKVGADLAVQRAQVTHEIRAVLTADQLEKIKGMELDVDARIDQFLDRIAKRVGED
jgi:Spy/CpxP family protein refolding chaperone